LQQRPKTGTDSKEAQAKAVMSYFSKPMPHVDFDSALSTTIPQKRRPSSRDSSNAKAQNEKDNDDYSFNR